MNINTYLSHFDKFTKDPTLEAMEYIMSKFDNPHKKVKCIHIAGTNGKGSVCEMINNCLVEAGYNVGKFMSPHLITFNDGICINNKPILDTEVEEILIPLSKVIEEYNKTHKVPVKWFEVITSLAFIYFYKKQCDIAIIETGLGGTTDCTNIVEPLVSVITTIGYDHMDILGKNLKEIMSHKAGIIKSNSETIFIDQPEVVDIVKEKCKKEKNTLHLIKTEDIETIVHKARMEKLVNNPCIIFDGGHNENAIRNLKQNIEQYYKNKKRVYIISILQTKDYNTIIKELSEDNEAVFYFTNGVQDRPYVPAKTLKEEAIKYIEEERVNARNLEEAIKEVKEKYKDRTIFIIGSFYVYKNVIKALKE